jgi:protein-S-isoprenylcysteine O-methyltransferase Ste14
MMREFTILAAGIILGGGEIALGLWVAPHNWLGWFLVFVGAGYVLGGGIYLAFSGGVKSAAPQSDKTLLALVPGAVGMLLLPALEYQLIPALIPRGPAMPLLGVALITAGMAVRIWVRLSLGKRYTGHLQTQARPKLVTYGPYRVVRHPGYASFVLQALGIAVGFSSLLGLLSVGLFLAGLAYRIKIEETLLVREFGEEYTLYQQVTRRLIPWVW